MGFFVMKDIYQADHLKRSHYSVPLTKEKQLIKNLAERSDSEAERLKRYIALSDLTRTTSSPLKAVVEAVTNLPIFQNFDIIDTPEIISSVVVFDLFNFPKDHPARNACDTYYVDDEHILRPHTSLMWKYYFDIPEVKERLEKQGSIGALSYGKIYRRDEIDWQHSNICHQFDGLFICRKDIKKFSQSDMENICSEVTRSLLGQNVKEDFRVDKSPCTDPSIEMSINWDDKWVEVNGAGIVHSQVLRNLGIDADIYNGWAFGFGVDRLTMLKMRIPDIRLLRSKDERVTKQLKDINNTYEPVGNYPPVVRNISFIIDKATFDLNTYYETVRETVGDEYVEEMKILDEYENDKTFEKNKISYTFRIVYRHIDRKLTNEEVNKMHENLHDITESKYNAKVKK